MKNPVASLVRSVVRWFHRISYPSRARQQAVNPVRMESSPPLLPPLSPEEFRRMLVQTLASDPEAARLILKPLIGAVIPFVGGAPCGTLAQDVVLTRESSGQNATNNTFVALTLLFRGAAGDAGIYLGDCDNNSFYRTHILAGGSQEHGVVADVTIINQQTGERAARSNYFYHLESDGGFHLINSVTPLVSGQHKNFIDPIIILPGLFNDFQKLFWR